MTSIVQVVADGRPGGGTTAVLTLSRRLAEQGHEVVVVCQQDSYLCDEAAKAGLGVRGIDFSRRLNSLGTAAKLRRHLGQIEPDVVHAHGARAGLPTVLAAKWSGARKPRIAYTVHGFHFLAKPAGLFHLARAAEWMCIALADRTNFVSDGDRRIAREQGLLKHSRGQTTIKNAVEVGDNFEGCPKRHDIAFVGRLAFQKNPLLLIDILKTLRPLKPTLLVIGGGPLEAEFRARIAQEGLGDQVVLHGECARADALRLAAACRMLLLPSRWEGHPITLIEAAHLGLPVVASQISGNDEIVKEGRTGFLVPASDPAAYARRIAELLADGPLRSRLAEAARVAAARDFSPQRMVAEHLELYGVARDPAPPASVVCA